MKTPTKEKTEKGIYGVPETASLWLLIPRLAIGIIISTIFLFAIFWLQFGEVSTFVALAALLVAVFQVFLVIGLRHQKTLATNVHRPPGSFDRLGSFWLVAAFFGTVFAWFTSDWANAYPSTLLHIVTVIMSILLPIATSIPNYRYVTAPNAYITIPILTIVTLIPSIVGWGSTAALWNSIFN